MDRTDIVICAISVFLLFVNVTCQRPNVLSPTGGSCLSNCEKVYNMFMRHTVYQRYAEKYRSLCESACHQAGADGVRSTKASSTTTPSTTTTSITTTTTTPTTTTTTTTPTTTTTTTPTTTTTTTPTTTTTTTTPTTTTTTTTPTTTTTTTPTTTTTTTTSTTTTTTTTPTSPITFKPQNKFECGVRQKNTYRIINGNNAEECEFPWMVGVQVRTVFCGGTLIDSRHVVTAAHCFKILGQTIRNPRLVTVLAGSSRISNLRSLAVGSIHVDPRHVSGTNDYDVTVLRLAQNVTFSECLRPICLPEIGEEPLYTDGCLATGWGVTKYGESMITKNLQKVNLPIVPLSVCRRSYTSRLINSLKVCAGDFHRGGIDTCQGDSGGPLVCLSNGRYSLHGIISFGYGCALPHYPGIYTRVAYSDIMAFIKAVTGLE